MFKQTVIGNKPYALVLNKADLADLKNKQLILKKLEEMDYKSVFFTSLNNQNDSSVKRVSYFFALFF